MTSASCGTVVSAVSMAVNSALVEEGYSIVCAWKCMFSGMLQIIHPMPMCRLLRDPSVKICTWRFVLIWLRISASFHSVSGSVVIYCDMCVWCLVVGYMLIVGCSGCDVMIGFVFLKSKYAWMLVGDIRTLFHKPVIGSVFCELF